MFLNNRNCMVYNIITTNKIALFITAALFILVGCVGTGTSGTKNTSATNATTIKSSNSSDSKTSISPQVVTSNTLEGTGTLPVIVSPDNAKIRYTGRVNITSSYALYDWADTQIEFSTSASQIELLFNDGKSDYNLFVDGTLKNIISTLAGKSTYLFNLAAGSHHVLLTKRTGPNSGSSQFLGVRLSENGKLLDLPVAPERKIEFIGDSYTVGYGDEASGVDCGGVYRPYENSYLSYAPVTARALNAQSHSIAVSGKGAVRNYGDKNTTSAGPMPDYYNRTLMERADLPWNFKSWIPNAVVVKLGTNDYSTQPEPPADVYLKGINDLIAQVNAAYGQVPIILVADNSLPKVISNLQTVVQQQHKLGNLKVYFVQVTMPPQNQLGCDWHPSVAGQASMAAELTTALRSILGWQENASSAVGTPTVTPFKDGAKGAYSMVFDDYCAAWTSGIDQYAIPGLLEHGFRAGLGAIASECEKNNFQPRLKTVADQGFEIVSHSWSHPALVACATKPDANQGCSEVRPDLSLELDKARTFLEQASGKPITFFVFPYNSVDDVVLNHLREKGYLGARGGTYALNPADFSDPIKLNKLGNQTDMNALADSAVKDKAFAFINFHGIADASYLPVPLNIWKTHLDYLKTLVNKHDLWIDNPTAIVKYNRTKALCGTPHINGDILTFSGAQPNCDTYVTGITVSISNDAGVPDLQPIQNNIPLSTRRLSTTTVLIENVDPRFKTQFK